jgi:hypothetical protein
MVADDMAVAVRELAVYLKRLKNVIVNVLYAGRHNEVFLQESRFRKLRSLGLKLQICLRVF